MSIDERTREAILANLPIGLARRLEESGDGLTPLIEVWCRVFLDWLQAGEAKRCLRKRLKSIPDQVIDRYLFDASSLSALQTYRLIFGGGDPCLAAKRVVLVLRCRLLDEARKDRYGCSATAHELDEMTSDQEAHLVESEERLDDIPRKIREAWSSLPIPVRIILIEKSKRTPNLKIFGLRNSSATTASRRVHEAYRAVKSALLRVGIHHPPTSISIARAFR